MQSPWQASEPAQIIAGMALLQLPCGFSAALLGCSPGCAFSGVAEAFTGVATVRIAVLQQGRTRREMPAGCRCIVEGPRGLTAGMGAPGLVVRRIMVGAP